MKSNGRLAGLIKHVPTCSSHFESDSFFAGSKIPVATCARSRDLRNELRRAKADDVHILRYVTD